MVLVCAITMSNRSEASKEQRREYQRKLRRQTRQRKHNQKVSNQARQAKWRAKQRMQGEEENRDRVMDLPSNRKISRKKVGTPLPRNSPTTSIRKDGTTPTTPLQSILSSAKVQKMIKTP